MYVCMYTDTCRHRNCVSCMYAYSSLTNIGCLDSALVLARVATMDSKFRCPQVTWSLNKAAGQAGGAQSFQRSKLKRADRKAAAILELPRGVQLNMSLEPEVGPCTVKTEGYICVDSNRSFRMFQVPNVAEW